MLHGSIEAFTFGLDVDVLRLLWIALGASVVATVWLGDAKEGGTDERERTKERLETALRTLSNLISSYALRRDTAKNAAVKRIDAGEDLTDVANESQKSSATDSRAPQAQTGDLQNAQINSVDFWREDYWNFEFNLEGDLFAADEEKKENADAWKESLKDEEDKEEEKGKPDDETEQDDAERDKGRANYFGAFFRNRNYPPDATDPDAQERKKERSANAIPRWRRREEARDESDRDESDRSETDVDKETRLSDDSIVFPSDDEPSEQEADDGEDYVPWSDGPDFDYLEDESVSLDDKIVYLRKRFEEGDECSRVELARLLIQKAAISNDGNEAKVLSVLDEAERILREVGAQRSSNVYDDGEYSELLGQALLQRPVFYLRNGLKPPMKTANDALNQIRSWAEGSFSFESRRLLATAWQTHGNCLLATGGDSSALSSFRESREMFESLADEGCEEVEPSLAFVAAATAETYVSIGDFPKALDAYREALTFFDKYSDQEAFLAEKVNVFFRMSSVYRRVGDDEKAVRALQDALESEERLVSFNEGAYFAPLTQLLESHAELLASKGDYEDAIASLDRAVSTLKRVLAYDSALSRRVLAYAHIENVLRRRASLHMCQERYARAAEDVEESLEYLALAIKKEDAFNPSLQIVFSSCLLFDLCGTQGLWEYAAKTQETLERILERFTPNEKKNVATLYAQLLMQRHILLARSERGSEALQATNRAIETLEALQDEELEDGGVFRDSLLSKAYCQRASFLVGSNTNKKKFEGALDDYRRARELSERELIDGETKTDFYAFYLELLGQKAAAELRVEAFDAMEDDLRQGISIVVGLLHKRRWRFLDELAKLSRLVAVWARASKNEAFALRVVCLFVAYARRLRRRYVESEWDADEQEDDSPRSRTILLSLEAFVVDMRRARADLLETGEWNDEYAQYCECGDLGARKVAVRKIARQNESTASKEKDVDVAAYDLDGERERFVREILTDDLKTRTVFLDYEFGLRAIIRRVISGEIDLAPALYSFLDKTTDVYIAKNEPLLAAEETSDVVRIFDEIVEKRRYDKDETLDSSRDEEENLFWTLAAPFWELQAALLARTSLDALESLNGLDDDAERAEVAKASAKVASLRTEVAYMKAVRGVKKIPRSNPAAPVRFGVVVGAFFAWLVRMGRVEEGVAFARAEGEALERRFRRSPVGFLVVGTYYDNVSQVALQSADDRVFAKECLLKVRDALTSSRAFVGGIFPPPLLERLGSVERRLATIASKDGDETEADARLRSSANYYSQCVVRDRFQRQAFEGFAEALGALFNSNSAENGKLASVLFRQLEKRAKSWNKKARRESLPSIWILLGQAASYYDRKRGCFYEANRIYKKRDAFVGDFLSDANEFGFHFFEEKIDEANFYIRNGVEQSAIKALETAIDARRAHTRMLNLFWKESDSKDDLTIAFVLDGFQRQIDCANVSLAQLIWRRGSADKVREIVDETLRSMEERPEVSARVLPSDNKKSLARLLSEFAARCVSLLRKQKEATEPSPTKRLIEDDASSYLRAYFSLREYAAILEIPTSGYDRAFKSFSELLQEIRLSFGRNSQIEKSILYYWADVAIDSKRWSDAIRFTSPLLRRERLDKTLSETELPFYVDALKISAFARLQRRRLGDLILAKREIDHMLKLVYSEFRAQRFALRASFAEALFLRAIVERAQGRKEEALKDAERAARLMERARKRGVGAPTRYVEALTAPFLGSLRAELNASAGLQEGDESQ